MQLGDEKENMDDMSLTPTQLFYNPESWWQAFSASINSIHDDSMQELQLNVHNSIELKRLDMGFIPEFNKKGILTKQSIVRTVFWYQIILEKMAILFKKRISKCLILENYQILIQNEMNLFVTHLNELTENCQQKITQILQAVPQSRPAFKQLTQDEKFALTDFLIQHMVNSFILAPNIEDLANTMKIDFFRAKQFLRNKRNAIWKYTAGEDTLPKWMLERYSQELQILKDKNLKQDTNQPIFGKQDTQTEASTELSQTSTKMKESSSK